MKNVLIVGHGKRVRGSILPALHCLRDSFKIVGIHTRSSGHSLEEIDFAKLDLIIVAVTLSEVPNVLRRLAIHDVKHITLMLDTPVLAIKNIFAVRYFKHFKKALISEDTIALPPFLLARRIIDEGKIGRIKSISFFHNGYKYHALASLKMLTNEYCITSIYNNKLSKEKRVKKITFSNGVKASFFEPRDYNKGKFLIEGEKGSIADYDYKGSNVFKIGYLTENNLYKGLTLNGQNVLPDQIEAKYLANISSGVEDVSLMNSMKIVGLMRLILASVENKSPFHYSPAQGIYDNIAISLSEYGLFVNFGLARLLKYIYE